MGDARTVRTRRCGRAGAASSRSGGADDSGRSDQDRGTAGRGSPRESRPSTRRWWSASSVTTYRRRAGRTVTRADAGSPPPASGRVDTRGRGCVEIRGGLAVSSRRSGRGEELSRAGGRRAALPVSEQAEVENAHEAPREHMQQKAPQEFLDVERHNLRASSIGVVLPAELGDAVDETDQTRVRDRDPVRRILLLRSQRALRSFTSSSEASNSAGCCALTPVKCATCCRHDTPAATRTPSGAIALAAGSSFRSPICRETP